MKQNVQEKKKTEKGNGFFSFLAQREQKIDLAIFGAAYLLLFILIRVCYPYIDVTADTGSYIQSAKTGIISGYRPYGYSRFLAVVHGLSASMGFLFTAQFLLYAFSGLFFLFTVKYFFPAVRKWAFYLLAGFVILEPNAWALTDLAMSDSLFQSLTLLFITEAMWLNRAKSITGNVLLVAVHLLLLFLVFEVRYVALFYPLLSAVFLVARAQKKWQGALLALLPILLTVLVYNQTKSEMKKRFGESTFSAFGGWATANNAVSVLPYIELKPEELSDPDARFIHSVTTQFPDSVYSEKSIRDTDFMWSKTHPGKQALFLYRQQHPTSTYVKAWVHVGVMMGTYGNALIRKYPGLYLKHFLLPNAKQCFVHYPIFGYETFKPDSLQKEWFKLDQAEYHPRHRLFSAINPLLEIFFYLRWVIFGAGLVLMILRFRGFTPDQKPVLVTVLLFIICYIGFSVLSHPINNYRYLVPLYPFMLFIPYAALNRYLQARSRPDKK